ncbi:MAG: hypothetical protein KF833_00665 [Verrucomicrobiae bacterium]|nr:hypothetical protein [Verrucomicrobiae bacterium]
MSGGSGAGTGTGTGDGDEGPLPELNQAVLDSETLGRLFRDLSQCAEIVEVIPKFADRRMVEEGRLTLEEARALLESGAVRGVQVRYRYQGADWWDTLMVTGAGVRLVRIRHDFS